MPDVQPRGAEPPGSTPPGTGTASCATACTEHRHRLSVTGAVTAQDVQRLCAAVRDFIAAGATTIVLCDADDPVPPDMATVDAILRLHLATKQRGGRIRVCAQRHDLRALLHVTGLAEVVLDCRGARSAGKLDG